MNIKQLAQYDNEKKSATVAYILGFISWIIPFGFHKFYIGDKGMGITYIGISLTCPFLFESGIQEFKYLSTVLTLVFVGSMIVDLFTTRTQVKELNSKLMNRLGGDDFVG